MDDVPRPLAGVARTLDELYVLTREEGDPDWDEWFEAVPERDTKEFDVWLNSPEYELWVDPPSGAVRLERWTLSGGVGWPTVSEDASAVTPLGTASGRALLTPSFVGGVRLLPKLRSDLELTIEPLGRYAFDARSLAVDPDGRYLLIATRDRGLLRIDLAAPEAAPVCLLPPPGHGVDWVPIKSYEYESRPPRLGDSMHGERVLLLADEGGGHWVLIDRDNDGDFDDRKHLGGLQAKQLGFTRTTYVPDSGAGLTWS